MSRLRQGFPLRAAASAGQAVGQVGGAVVSCLSSAVRLLRAVEDDDNVGTVGLFRDQRPR